MNDTNICFEFVLEVLEEGRQESLPTILCEPEFFDGHSRPLKESGLCKEFGGGFRRPLSTQPIILKLVTALLKYHSNEHPLFAPVPRCRQSTMHRIVSFLRLALTQILSTHYCNI